MKKPGLAALVELGHGTPRSSKTQPSCLPGKLHWRLVQGNSSLLLRRLIDDNGRRLRLLPFFAFCYEDENQANSSNIFRGMA